MTQPGGLYAVPDPDQPAPAPGGGGNNGRYDRLEARLSAVERQLDRLDERTRTMATKEDIQKLKVWVLTGGGLAGGAMALITWVLRVFAVD